ncbi:hypothetical protein HDU96_001573 [Phlyctochytrium bullatum]|nr:hypothetical protein HDU96_001573 [Phlyctochytrium bullatum]
MTLPDAQHQKGGHQAVIPLNGGKTFQILVQNESLVLADYDPQMPDELELRIGDVIRLNIVHDDGWAHGVNLTTNESGMLPMAVLLKDASIPVPEFREGDDDDDDDAFSYTHTAIELLGPPKPPPVNRFKKYLEKTHGEQQQQQQQEQTQPHLQQAQQAVHNAFIPPPHPQQTMSPSPFPPPLGVPQPHPPFYYHPQPQPTSGFNLPAAGSSVEPARPHAAEPLKLRLGPLPTAPSPLPPQPTAATPQSYFGTSLHYLTDMNPNGRIAPTPPSEVATDPRTSYLSSGTPYTAGAVPHLVGLPYAGAPSALASQVAAGMPSGNWASDSTSSPLTLPPASSPPRTPPSAVSQPSTPATPPTTSGSPSNGLFLPPPPKRVDSRLNTVAKMRAAHAAQTSTGTAQETPSTDAERPATPSRSDSLQTTGAVKADSPPIVPGTPTPTMGSATPKPVNGAVGRMFVPAAEMQKEAVADARPASVAATAPTTAANGSDAGKCGRFTEFHTITMVPLKPPASEPATPPQAVADEPGVSAAAGADNAAEDDDEDPYGSYSDYLDYWLSVSASTGVPTDDISSASDEAESSTRMSRSISVVSSAPSRRLTAGPRPLSTVRRAPSSASGSSGVSRRQTQSSAANSIPSRRSSYGATLISAFNLIYGSGRAGTADERGSTSSSPLMEPIVHGGKTPLSPTLSATSGIPYRSRTKRSTHLSVSSKAGGGGDGMPPSPSDSPLVVPSLGRYKNLPTPVLPPLDLSSDNSLFDFGDAMTAGTLDLEPPPSDVVLPLSPQTTAPIPLVPATVSAFLPGSTLPPTPSHAAPDASTSRAPEEPPASVVAGSVSSSGPSGGPASATPNLGLFLSSFFRHGESAHQREVLVKLAELEDRLAAKAIAGEEYLEERNALMASLFAVFGGDAVAEPSAA